MRGYFLSILVGLIILSIFAISNSSAETSSFSSTPKKYVFMNEQFGYDIPYQITNGTVKSISMDCENWLLEIEIISTKNGKLEIDVSTELMDPLWMVLLDDEEAHEGEFNEPRLTVWFPSNTKKIEIIGGNLLTPNSGTCKKIHNPPHSYILSPLKQIKNGVEPNEVICKENLDVIFKSTNLSPYCVTPSSIQKLIERGWGNSDFEIIGSEDLSIYSLNNTKKGDFDIFYSLEGADLFQMKEDLDAGSLIINLENTVEGKLTIHIPRDLIDTVNEQPYDRFIVLENGEEVYFEETALENIRILEIEFSKGIEEIEIISGFW